jgi:Flp pilus assembly protein TadB
MENEEKKEEHHEHAHEHEHQEKKEETAGKKVEHSNEGAGAPSSHAPPSGKKSEQEKKQPPPSESKDLKDSRIFVIIFALAGAAMGILSSLLKSSGISSWITGGAGILLLIVLAFAIGKMFRRKLKFLATGLFLYLLMWLVIWIFMYNL